MSRFSTQLGSAALDYLQRRSAPQPGAFSYHQGGRARLPRTNYLGEEPIFTNLTVANEPVRFNGQGPPAPALGVEPVNIVGRNMIKCYPHGCKTPRVSSVHEAT